MNKINLREYKVINKFNEINQYGLSAQKYYLTLYCFYIELIIDYLIEKTNIKKYDEQIEKLNIKVKDNKNIYNKITKNSLKYFYIANSFSLNKLKDDDLMYLSNKICNCDYEYTERCKNIIKNTLKDTINRVKLQLKLNIDEKDRDKEEIKTIIRKLEDEVKGIFDIEIKVNY